LSKAPSLAETAKKGEAGSQDETVTKEPSRLESGDWSSHVEKVLRRYRAGQGRAEGSILAEIGSICTGSLKFVQCVRSGPQSAPTVFKPENGEESLQAWDLISPELVRTQIRNPTLNPSQARARARALAVKASELGIAVCPILQTAYAWVLAVSRAQFFERPRWTFVRGDWIDQVRDGSSFEGLPNLNTMSNGIGGEWWETGKKVSYPLPSKLSDATYLALAWCLTLGDTTSEWVFYAEDPQSTATPWAPNWYTTAPDWSGALELLYSWVSGMGFGDRVPLAAVEMMCADHAGILLTPGRRLAWPGTAGPWRDAQDARLAWEVEQRNLVFELDRSSARHRDSRAHAVVRRFGTRRTLWGNQVVALAAARRRLTDLDADVRRVRGLLEAHHRLNSRVFSDELIEGWPHRDRLDCRADELLYPVPLPQVAWHVLCDRESMIIHSSNTPMGMFSIDALAVAFVALCGRQDEALARIGGGLAFTWAGSIGHPPFWSAPVRQLGMGVGHLVGKHMVEYLTRECCCSVSVLHRRYNTNYEPGVNSYFEMKNCVPEQGPSVPWPFAPGARRFVVAPRPLALREQCGSITRFPPWLSEAMWGSAFYGSSPPPEAPGLDSKMMAMAPKVSQTSGRGLHWNNPLYPAVPWECTRSVSEYDRGFMVDIRAHHHYFVCAGQQPDGYWLGSLPRIRDPTRGFFVPRFFPVLSNDVLCRWGDEYTLGVVPRFVLGHNEELELWFQSKEARGAALLTTVTQLLFPVNWNDGSRDVPGPQSRLLRALGEWGTT